MQNPKATKIALIILLLICLAQLFWILLSRAPSPVLSRIESSQPLESGGMLYVVVSDSGGATVPFIWRYYVHERIDDPQRALAVLREEGEAFLVTRDAKARVEVHGSLIRVTVTDTVYSFRSSVLYRHLSGYTLVTIWLTAQPAEPPPGIH